MSCEPPGLSILRKQLRVAAGLEHDNRVTIVRRAGLGHDLDFDVLMAHPAPPWRNGGSAAHAGRSGRSPDRPRPPSSALDRGQAVLDPGLRPRAPWYGEELEPFLDKEVRV